MASVTYAGRQVEMLEYFESLTDYLWKLPDMLESQVELERRKLYEYFPPSPDPKIDARHERSRGLRSAHEAAKLFVRFPTLMASSALIQTVSAIEFYLLLICRDYEARGFAPLSGFRPRRRGAGRLIAYLEMTSPKFLDAPHLEQVEVAITFRNCLAHANGSLDLFKDADVVRKIVAGELYFPQGRRGRPRGSLYDPHPRMIDDDGGQRLFIPTYYSHWLAAEARHTLTALTVEAAWS